MNLRRQILAAILASALSGCGTINNRVSLSYFPPSNSDDGPFQGYAYGGVRTDATIIGTAFGNPQVDDPEDDNSEITAKNRMMMALYGTLFALDLPILREISSLPHSWMAHRLTSPSGQQFFSFTAVLLSAGMTLRCSNLSGTPDSS